MTESCDAGIRNVWAQSLALSLPSQSCFNFWLSFALWLLLSLSPPLSLSLSLPLSLPSPCSFSFSISFSLFLSLFLPLYLPLSHTHTHKRARSRCVYLLLRFSLLLARTCARAVSYPPSLSLPPSLFLSLYREHVRALSLSGSFSHIHTQMYATLEHSHVTHMDASCYMYERVMSHV